MPIEVKDVVLSATAVIWLFVRSVKCAILYFYFSCDELYIHDVFTVCHHSD